MPATVFIVDDDPDARRATAWLVGSSGLSVETFDSGEAFLNAFGPARAGCVVCDVRLPGICGLELQDRLRDAGSDIPVLLVTGYADVATAVRAMKGGAIDFLERPVDDRVLLDRVGQAIRRDAANRDARAERVVIAARFRTLSARERHVMDLVLEGLSSREIAERLQVVTKTADAHRATVMRKMEAAGIADLVRMSLDLPPALKARLAPGDEVIESE